MLKQEQLMEFLENQLKEMQQNNGNEFIWWLRRTIKGNHSSAINMQARYLFNEGILEDITKLQTLSKTGLVNKNKGSMVGSGEDSDEEGVPNNDDDGKREKIFEEEVRNSCIILENEFEEGHHMPTASELLLQEDEKEPFDGKNSNQNKNTIANIAGFNKKPSQQPTAQNMSVSFQNNMTRNESIIAQINIIYSKEYNPVQYQSSLKLFLKWIQFFNEHSFGGFLKPIYQSFCHYVYTLPPEQFPTIVDEISIFVQFMIRLYTEIYHLSNLNSTENGKLFKNQNIYNLVMSFLFKKSRIKQYLRGIIRKNEAEKIKKLEKQLEKFHRKSIAYFGVEDRFILIDNREKDEQGNDIEENIEEYWESLHGMQKKGKGESQLVMNECSQMDEGLNHHSSSHYDFNQSQKKNQGSVAPSNLTNMTNMKIPVFRSNIQTDCYLETLKLIAELSSSNNKESVTPVSKMKKIIHISKSIVKEINQFYEEKQSRQRLREKEREGEGEEREREREREREKHSTHSKSQQRINSSELSELEIPNLDPDNLISIIIYLICKNNAASIYEELRVIECFTTTNNLNSISGYYLNMFIASVDSIIEMK